VAVTRYSTEIDLGNLNTSHSLAILSVAPGSRVLDLGAADGSVARRLKERGCTVWAVEFDFAAAEAARQVCDRVIAGDLDGDDVWQALRGETFDVVLALDVLEHLRAPETALRRAAQHVADDGVVIISLPNITHGAIRLSLLEGRFRYQETGPLDSTHLRFFDRAGAEQLVHDAGLVIGERLRVSRGLHETEVPVMADDIAPELLATITRDPDATTYQFVFVARPQRRSAAVPPGAMLPERLLGELDALKIRFAEVEQYARNLANDRERLLALQAQREEELGSATRQHEEELGRATRQHEEELDRATEKRDAEHRRHIEELTAAATIVEHQRDELRAELERRMLEAHQRKLEIRHCKADLAVKQAFIDELREELQSESSKFEAAMHDARESAQSLRAWGDRLEAEVTGLRVYASSAGFRLVERVIAALKRIPFAYSAARALVRAIAGDRRL
jgi:2-polyprenyl-3-methyl-5-hydroxy-6-metoxy-1,4-benzoquinol methylase